MSRQSRGLEHILPAAGGLAAGAQGLLAAVGNAPRQCGGEATAGTEPWPSRAGSAEAVVLGPCLSYGYGPPDPPLHPDTLAHTLSPFGSLALREQLALAVCWHAASMTSNTFSELLVNPVNEELSPT